MIALSLFALLCTPSQELASVAVLLSASSSPSQLPNLVEASIAAGIPQERLRELSASVPATGSTEAAFRASLSEVVSANVDPPPIDAVAYLASRTPPQSPLTARPKHQQVGSVRVNDIEYNVTLSRDALDGHRRFYLSLTLPRPGVKNRPMKISRILAEVEGAGVYIRGAETVPTKRGGGVGVATIMLFKMIIASTLTRVDKIGTREIDKPVLAHTLVKAGFYPVSTHFPVHITPSEGGRGVIICHENRALDLRSHYSSGFLRSQNAVIGRRPEDGVEGAAKWTRTYAFTEYELRGGGGLGIANDTSTLTDVNLSAHRVLAFFAGVEDAWCLV